MLTKRLTTIGMCWYSKDQCTRLKEIATDPQAFDDSYEEWRREAEQAINKFRANGVATKEVLVDTEETLMWANEKGRPQNSETRFHRDRK